jgi:hypothetical protein
MRRHVPEDTSTFRYHDTNPKGKKTGDCVIRAISTATNQTWDEVYEALYKIGFKYKLMPDDPKCYERYLKELGWIKHKQPRKPDNTKYTGTDFISTEEYNNLRFSNHNIIARIGTLHLTAIINGKICDTWNCSYGKIGTYWTFEYK